MVKYCVSPDVVSQCEDGKMLLFHQSKARVLILSPSATFLWSHCEDGLDADAIPDLIESHYNLGTAEVSLEQATEMATRHLDRLTKAGFLECEQIELEGS